MLQLKTTNESLQITTNSFGTAIYQFPSDNTADPGTYYNDAQGVNIGVIFGVTQPAIVTGIRYYAQSPGIVVTPTIYNDDTNATLATGPAYTTTTSGWVFVPLGSPYTLSIGISYSASAFVSSGEYYANAASGFPLTDGPVYTVSDHAGRWAYSSSPARPINLSTTRYGVDAVVQSTAMPPLPTMSGYAYLNQSASSTSLTIAPDSTIKPDDWMILVFEGYVGFGTMTDPPGWTIIQPAASAGTQLTTIYAKRYVTGETSYTINLSASGNACAVSLMWGSGGAPISSWIIGANTLRSSSTPTINTAASITTTTNNTLALAISTERTNAMESGIISMTGATPWFYGGQYQSLEIETISVGYINKMGAGPTGDVTITYANPQTTNGIAIQIGIPPVIPNIDYSVAYFDSGSGSNFSNSSNEGKINTLTASTILPTPGSNINRLVKFLSITNTDAYASVAVSVQKKIDTTLYAITPTFILQAGEMIQYLDKVGWTYYAANGVIKQDQSLPGSDDQQVVFNSHATLLKQDNWTALPNSGKRQWNTLSSSKDGTKLAAADNIGNIWLSKDAGGSWVSPLNNSSITWKSIASSSDGTKLAACGATDYIYTSADGGLTWVAQSGSAQNQWQSITSSADGTKLAAVALDTSVYTSSDSGVTWTAQSSGALKWKSIASSADGTKLVAVALSTVAVSSDSGVTWTQQTLSGATLVSVASSSDGTKLVAAATASTMYTSVDSGVTWTQQTASGTQNWTTVVSSDDGTKLLVGTSDNGTQLSTNSGITWIQQTSAGKGNWSAVAMSSDGTKTYAALNTDFIYSNLTTSPKWTRTTGSFTPKVLSLTNNPSVDFSAWSTDAPATSQNTLSLYSRSISNNPLPITIDSTGSPSGIQSGLYQISHYMWTPGPTNVGTWINTSGVNVGSAATVLPTTTNIYTAMRRSTFSNVVTTTNQQVGIRSDNTFLRGITAREGGFLFVCRFGFDAIAAGSRAFIGFCPSTAIVSNDPSASLNTLGFGFDLADNNWSFYHNGASGTATKEPISPATSIVANNAGYDAYIWSAPGSNKVYYRLDRTDTGVTLGEGSVTTNLPVNTTALMMTAQASNGTANTTANAVVLGVNRLYAETLR